jgi:PEP-CTERM motif
MEKNMKAMHVRAVVVLVLLWVACGSAEAYRDDDMDVSALTRREPVVEDTGTWSGAGTQGGWVWPGAVTNSGFATGKVVAVSVNLTDGSRPIPEPSTTMLVCVGLLTMLLLGRRR